MAGTVDQDQSRVTVLPSNDVSSQWFFTRLMCVSYCEMDFMAFLHETLSAHQDRHYCGSKWRKQCLSSIHAEARSTAAWHACDPLMHEAVIISARGPCQLNSPPFIHF